MKREFSKSWIRSRQARKQRKYRYNAPLHVKHRFLNANLSKELRKKHGKRSIPLKKGDEVLIMRGKFVGKKGKIDEINLKKNSISVENVNRAKIDGSKTKVYINTSNVQIQGLNTDDARRFVKNRNQKIKSEKEEKNAFNKS